MLRRALPHGLILVPLCKQNPESLCEAVIGERTVLGLQRPAEVKCNMEGHSGAQKADQVAELAGRRTNF